MNSYIDHILANYLNSSLGYSEEEAISFLRNDLKTSAELEKGLRADLVKAFNSDEYSWKNVLEEHEVYFAESEADAHAYARKILWIDLFD